MAKKVEAPFLRSAFNYDRNEASDESGLACLDESRTKQSFAEEVDINTIMRRFGQTGKLPDSVVPPTYQDFVGIFDFHSAMNAVAQAGEAFDKMPADVRYKFNNDPGAFVAFCSDEKNLEEMSKLGLTSPEFEVKLAEQRRAAEERIYAERRDLEEKRKGDVESGVDGLRAGSKAIDGQGGQSADYGAPGARGSGNR